MRPPERSVSEVIAFAPGRVNLIGDHTDHTGGLCLPMALDMGVTVRGVRGGEAVELTSQHEATPASVPLDVSRPREMQPPWARYVAGVVAELRPPQGLRGTVASDLPVGAGLSSSAALEVALALALGFAGTDTDLAAACQRAEHAGTGVPCGILDQLASVGGVEGHALLLDCHAVSIEPIPVAHDIAFVIVHSGEQRSLGASAYGARRAECEEAQDRIGPLRLASADDVERVDDPVLRRRARHVVSENQRVLDAVDALLSEDGQRLGELFVASHRSLRDDFESSTPVVDATVERLCSLPGVHGARMTGGGWGGCVVAVAEPGALDEGWAVRPGPGARIEIR